VIRGDKSETQALGDVARWVAPLVQHPWDMLVNWSYSESSSYLTGLLPARVKLGYSRRRDAQSSCSDGWSHYIQAIVQGGVEQNIHLTDILTTQLLTALQIHVGEPADEGDAPVTSKGFFALEVHGTETFPGWKDPSRKWIGIQLGAGHDSKTWPVESWAKLASLILDRHAETGIVLMGGTEDAARAHAFYEQLRAVSGRAPDARRVVSLVGKTTFDTWASVVGRCQWVLSGDTAALHLASVLGTRVLNLSVGPVRWAETGPYGNGHYILSSSINCPGCDSKSKKTAEHRCRTDVTADAAYAAWSYASSEWAHRCALGIEEHFGQLGFGRELGSVHVHRSKIRNTQDGGGVVYEALIQRSLKIRDWTSQVMGHIARAWYCGWVPPVAHEVTRQMVSPSLIRELRNLEDSSSVLSKICEEAKRTAQTLQNRSSRLKSDKVMPIGERAELQDLGKRLIELEKLLERLGKAHAPLAAFAQMSKVLMHNLKGEQLAELGRESAECYAQLGQGAQILRDWIGRTLQLARPVAVQATPAAVVRLNNREVTP
jgi:ADP-heptose:LPS heptosyltransferase